MNCIKVKLIISEQKQWIYFRIKNKPNLEKKQALYLRILISITNEFG